MKGVANGLKHTIAGNRIDSITIMTMGTTMGVNKNSNIDGVACGGVKRRTPASVGNCKRAVSGFTLIEIMIVVAIIGILAAIAVPAYSIFITKANRTDAMNFLSEVAGEQQRYFSENNEYASAMKELDYGNAATFPSPEGHYTISVSNSTSANLDYILSATPVVGGRQANDDECDVFTISSTGAKANTGGSSNNCW